jgi:DMSO/TMAO reductase YedYZ molybdopterin-dependent catalytic subunit
MSRPISALSVVNPTAFRRALLGLGLLALLLAAEARAQPAAAADAEGVVEVRGDVTPGQLTVRELQAMPPSRLEWTVHGKTRTVVGVPLAKALERFGVLPGPMTKEMAAKDKRAGYKKVIVASAPDGFQSVLSVAEISEGMGKTQALLVYKIDDKPLPQNEKPLRLVVVSDGEPSRSLYQLARIDIVDLRKIIPPAQPKK